MAVSNRDRIGQMFDVLAPALETWIAGVLDQQSPEGRTWVPARAVRDSKKGISTRTPLRGSAGAVAHAHQNIPSKLKPGWYPFDGQLRSMGSSVRNRRATPASCVTPVTVGPTRSLSPTMTSAACSRHGQAVVQSDWRRCVGL